MDLVLPDSKEKDIGKHTLQSPASLPVDCRRGSARQRISVEGFDFLSCFERGSTFKYATKSQTSSEFIAHAKNQWFDYCQNGLMRILSLLS